MILKGSENLNAPNGCAVDRHATGKKEKVDSYALTMKDVHHMASNGKANWTCMIPLCLLSAYRNMQMRVHV